MRSPIVAILAIVILASVIMIPGADAEKRPDNYPTELAELQFYNAGGTPKATVLYVYPDKPIGDIELPTLYGTQTCWVRMDTREVITPQTVFAQGTYLIEPYSVAPQPWTVDPEPEQSQDHDDPLPIIAIVLSSAAIITSGVAIVMMIRRK